MNIFVTRPELRGLLADRRWKSCDAAGLMLELVAREGGIDEFSRMLTAGTDPNCNELRAVVAVGEMGDLEKMELLIAAGADIRRLQGTARAAAEAAVEKMRRHGRGQRADAISKMRGRLGVTPPPDKKP
jgi:hypothetical protein